MWFLAVFWAVDTVLPRAVFKRWISFATGVAANTTEIKVLAPPVDHTSNSRSCPIDRAKFTAVRTVYVMASEASQAYRLHGLKSQSLTFQKGSSGTQLLQHMWEQAAASDEALQGFQWLPGAPPVVQLQPRHAAADRVQRATERDVLTGLSKTFERAFCMRLGPTALVRGCAVLSCLRRGYCTWGCMHMKRMRTVSDARADTGAECGAGRVCRGRCRAHVHRRHRKTPQQDPRYVPAPTLTVTLGALGLLHPRVFQARGVSIASTLNCALEAAASLPWPVVRQDGQLTHIQPTCALSHA